MTDKSILKRLAFVLTILYIFLGCSPQWHLERADKHLNKAIDKGAEIKADTIYVSGDTIRTSYTQNDTVYITNTIKEVKFLQGEVRYITKKDKRQERRKQKRDDKYNYKLKKQEIKSESKRSYWYIWYGLGILTILALKFFWNKYIKFFFNRKF